MLMLIRQLGDHFDHIVVDAPPILGLADAPLLSRAVEGCIFVVEAEGVAVRGVKSSLGRLHSVHAHVFGVILTKLKHRQAGYGYGYGHGYGHGYGYGNDAQS
jgi:Mrp family chromosome partitioning ATPase